MIQTINSAHEQNLWTRFYDDFRLLVQLGRIPEEIRPSVDRLVQVWGLNMLTKKVWNILVNTSVSDVIGAIRKIEEEEVII